MPTYYSLSDVPASWQNTTSTEIIPIPTDKFPLPVCVVTGRVTIAVADLPTDLDAVPEAEKLNGTGTITAVATTPLLAPHFPAGPLSVYPGTVEFQVTDGEFRLNGTAGVGVIAGDIHTLPTSVVYKIELDVHDSDNNDVAFPVVQFAATQGTVDYTMLQGVA